MFFLIFFDFFGKFCILRVKNCKRHRSQNARFKGIFVADMFKLGSFCINSLVYRIAYVVLRIGKLGSFCIFSMHDS